MSTIAGAKWCGFSMKQYKHLECKKQGDTHTCSNGHTFVWCEDENGETNDHPVCSGVSAYPTWFQEQDGAYVMDHEGYKEEE